LVQANDAHGSVQINAIANKQKRCVMTELFTMIVLAANIIVVSAFAKFAPTATAAVSTVHEQSSDVDTFEGRVVARIRARDTRSAAARDISESAGAYWGSPLF
jgi:hypothetical protein